MLALETESPAVITDDFIPELFYDYFYTLKGRVTCTGPGCEYQTNLPAQTLKTIHKQPIKFTFSTPLVLLGARLSLKFAEWYWGTDIQSDRFIEQNWVDGNTGSLESFASQITATIHKYRVSKTISSMLSPTLEESPWLSSYSARHKRRLYQTVFGLTKKEMWNIRNVHLFLDQACDFASHSPRIIQHVNPGVFHDQPHLNHTFKKITGFSPVEYFQTYSILQDHLVSASYNAIQGG